MPSPKFARPTILIIQYTVTTLLQNRDLAAPDSPSSLELTISFSTFFLVVAFVKRFINCSTSVPSSSYDRPKFYLSLRPKFAVRNLKFTDAHNSHRISRFRNAKKSILRWAIKFIAYANAFLQFFKELSQTKRSFSFSQCSVKSSAISYNNNNNRKFDEYTAGF